jgi:hypothetical protein
MLRRSRTIASTASASLPALALLSLLLLTAGHEACAQQLNLSIMMGLDFGRFVANTGGTVIMPATGPRGKGPGSGVILLNSGTGSAAQFNVSGNSKKAVIISLPTDGSTKLTNNSFSMAVGTFTTSPTLTTVTTGGTTLNVGATLTVGPNQASGTYSGSFQLIINYQ